MEQDLTVASHGDAVEGIVSDLIVSGADAPEFVVPLLAAIRMADKQRLEEILADPLTLEDRRNRTDTPMRSRAQLIDALSAYGRNAFDVRLLAVRAGRYAMSRLMFERTEGGVADMVVIVGGNGGMADAIQIHDTASFSDAVRVFSGAYVTSLSTELQATVGVSAATLGAIVERRYEDLAERLSPDFEFRDYREAMPHTIGRDESLELIETIFEDEPGLYDYVPEVLDLTTRGLVATYTQATVADLGATDVEVVVMGVVDGQLTSLNMFDVQHVDRARRLLRSWG